MSRLSLLQRLMPLLVNDSNYFLYFSVLIRDNEAKAWKSLFTGEVAPNEMIDLASFTQPDHLRHGACGVPVHGL